MPPRGRGQGRRSEFFILSDFNLSITVFVQNRNVDSIKPLKKLDLSHNEIEDLLQDSFVDIINLEELDLSHNLLTDLKRKAVYRMPRLRSVKLSNNRIQNFHSDSFDSTPLIDELRLNHNRLTDVSDVSFVMDALPRLRLLGMYVHKIKVQDKNLVK